MIRIHRLTIPLLALVVALLGSPGCAGTLPRIQALPAQIETTDRNLTAVVGNLEQLLALAVEAALPVSRIEDEAAKTGVISASVDAEFDRVATAFYAEAKRVGGALKDARLESWPALRELVQPVLDRAQALIDVAQNIGAIKSQIRGFLAKFRDALSLAVGEYMFGGAR